MYRLSTVAMFLLLGVAHNISALTLPITKLNTIPEFNAIFSLLAPFDIDTYTRLRLGKIYDGGYIMPKELIDKIERCYTYGAGDDVSFETSLNEVNKNIITRIYDHTTSFPDTITPNVFFKKEGLAAQKEGELNTFANHLHENGDADKSLLLKLDIEGAEWDVLDKLDDELLDKAVVLIVEFHWFRFINNIQLYTRVLEKISKKFTVFDVHGNNCVPILEINGKLFPDVVEITFVNNKHVNSKTPIKTVLVDKDTTTLNCPTVDNYTLDFWL